MGGDGMGRRGLFLVFVALALTLAAAVLLLQNHTFVRYKLSLAKIEVTKPFLSLPEALEASNFIFPSVEKRVRYYMGDYYEDAAARAVLNFSSELCRDIPAFRAGDEVFLVGHGRPYVFDKGALPIKRWSRTTGYQHDALKYFDGGCGGNETSNNLDSCVTLGDRIIFQFGDELVSKRHQRYPIMVKARAVQPPGKGHNVPILAFLNVRRHYGQLASVRQYHPWEEKRSAIVFRGSATGKRLEILRPYVEARSDALARGEEVDFDFAFTSFPLGPWPHFSLRFNATTRNSLWGGRLSSEQLTRYKYLLALPGNDVSTGLKWMLYSDSVVFMPKPKVVSWAMEDYLVPYVHYVPVREDLTDLRGQLEWARRNDNDCRNIARWATQYMADLYASEKAQRDNDEVRRLISRRYRTLYGPALSQCD